MQARLRSAQSTRSALPPGVWLLIVIAAVILREGLMAWRPALVNDDVTAMWQFLTPQDLTLPWTSLLFMHHQPPVWNALYWLSNHLLGDASLLFWVNKLSSYISALAVWALMSPWCGRSRATVAALVFLFLPEVVAYEGWRYSSQFTMMLLTLNLLCFSLASRAEGRARQNMAWCWMLTMLVLAMTRQTYHVALLLGILWLVGLKSLRLPVRQLVLMSVLLAAPVLAWQAKNDHYFGTHNMSSWMSRNLFKIVSSRVPPEQLQADRDAGCGAVTTITPFAPVEAYEHLPEVQAYKLAHQGIAAQVPQSVSGFNSLTYAATAPLYMKATLCVFKRHPLVYLNTAAQAWALYFTPSTDYEFVRHSVAPWDGPDTLIRRLVYLQPANDIAREHNLVKRLQGRSYMLPIIFVWFSWLTLRWLWRGEVWQSGRSRALIGYAMLLVWVNCVSNFADVGENMRFRYDVGAIYYVGLLMLGHQVWVWIRSRRGVGATPASLPQPELAEPMLEGAGRKRA